ncbi:MAG: anti-sigma factor [Syntrophobacteraceae bacterium]
MKCKRVLSRLSAFRDGEVPVGLAREMEEHLADCLACREQVERIRRVGDLLDQQPIIPPLPSAFAARVMAQARRRVAPVTSTGFTSRGRWRFQWLFDLSVPMRVAVCGAVLLASVMGIFMSQEVFLSKEARPVISDVQSLDGFEWFSPTPPKSLGSACLFLATPVEDH